VALPARPRPVARPPGRRPAHRHHRPARVTGHRHLHRAWPLTARRPDPGSPRRAGSRDQPARAGLPLPCRQALALLQLQPARPGLRLPGYRVARCRRPWPVDLAQPAARVLHRSPVHLETRRHRRVMHGRARQRPHHPPDVRRHHRRRPRPRPQSHRMTPVRFFATYREAANAPVTSRGRTRLRRTQPTQAKPRFEPVVAA
jgi:hypothetical protein